MTITIDDLQRYDYNQIALYGKREDQDSWYFSSEAKYIGDECLATAQEVYTASTGYDSGLWWEMENEEEDEGYEAECAERDAWESEEYEVRIPDQLWEDE